MADNSGLMSVKDFSEYSSIPQSTIYRLIRNSFFPPGVVLAVGPSRVRIRYESALSFMGSEQQRKQVVRRENAKLRKTRKSISA